jgi:hypothetical protein
MGRVAGAHKTLTDRREKMHDLFIATAFVAILLAPCLVAIGTKLDPIEETR